MQHLLMLPKLITVMGTAGKYQLSYVETVSSFIFRLIISLSIIYNIYYNYQYVQPNIEIHLLILFIYDINLISSSRPQTSIA